MVQWTLATTRFPEQDAEALKGLAIGAGWLQNLLNNPPKQAPASKDERRCPVLPRCFPIIPPNGLVVSHDNKRFHGFQLGETKSNRCPFR